MTRRTLLWLALAAMPAFAEDSAYRKLRMEYEELVAKADAIVDTVNALEDRARENGQPLHPQIVAARSLVRSSMADAAAALKKKDRGALRESLKRARGSVDRLSRII